MLDGFSTVDGFMDVNEGLAEMIKYAANEPSVGLYYIQQHTQSAVPNLLNLKDKIVDKSHEVTLHTEDLEDSIDMVRSMKECGLSIAAGMVKDIRKSLIVMSSSQPQRGLIHNRNSGFEIGRSSSWGPTAFGRNIMQQDSASSVTYLSTVLKSAKQKAVSIRWPQLDAKQSSSKQSTNPPRVKTSANTILTLPDKEAEELPLSSQIVEEPPEGTMPLEGGPPSHDLLSVTDNYEAFKAVREAKLEEWLEE